MLRYEHTRAEPRHRRVAEQYMDKPTNKVYEYENYRRFLRDYFKEQKALRATFSHRNFARRAGFSSSSFCAHVIEGKRNLTEKSVKKMIRGLRLSGRAAAFFESLVFYNQAKTIEDRENRFREMERLRKASEFYKINQDQFAYYDEWYYPVIRELVVHSDWGGDYDRLALLVRPAVSPEKARKAVHTLLDIGLLVENSDGTFSQKHQSVTAGGVPSAVTRKVRKEYLLRALEATEELSVDRRHISGLTVAMSEEQYRKTMQMIDELRIKILREAEAEDESLVDGVYQVNFQAFPLTKKSIRRARNDEGGRR